MRTSRLCSLVLVVTFAAACESSDGSGPKEAGADAGPGEVGADAGTGSVPDSGSSETQQYAVGGVVSGLAGKGLILQLNGGGDLPVPSSGAFMFPTLLDRGATYAVTVKSQPSSPTQQCSVSGGTGAIVAGNVMSVTINCETSKFTVGGGVSGLAGSGLVLQNNAGDDLPVNANGTFAFPTTVASGAGYAVSVKTQPSTPEQTCVVASGIGTVAGEDVSSVTVTCTTNKYTVGGTLAGLEAGKSIVLHNNGGDATTVNANGPFTFATSIDSGAAYAVTVATAPAGQLCVVERGTGNVAATNVTDVAVVCARSWIEGNYATFVAAAAAGGAANTLVPGDKVSEPNNHGGFFFKLGPSVTSVRITITGAGGSRGGSHGGTGGSGTVDLTPAFLADRAQSGFWIVLGQAGKASAGPSGPLTAYRSFNGGGAGTEWTSCCGGKDTFTSVAGGGGGSDLRFGYDGDPTSPHTGDPTLSWAGRFAVVGGGGGGTNNDGGEGGGGGAFNANGLPSVYPGTPGLGGTLAAGGNVGGVLGLGGDGKTDNTQGWSGGGGGGYYGGGSSPAHGGGGGGSGYLLDAAGLINIASANGTTGGNAATDRSGAFAITAF